jgi:tRNA(Ile)-lysidine synthase
MLTNQMNDSTENILQKYVKKNSKIIIGVSGGADSILLLRLCHEAAKKLNFHIIIAHVDHNVRTKSHKDAVFVHDIAAKFHIPFELIKITHKPKGNMEEQFRKIRYEFFEELRKKYKASWILTAHHLNDNIETILFNLIRGSSIEGLGGMETADKKRKILRPLLNVSRQEIINSLKKKKIKYVEDETNKDEKFSRNLIRHKIIPEFKKINPNLEQTFTQNIINLKETKDFIQKKTAAWLKSNYKNNKFEAEKFLKLHPVIQKTALASIYRSLYGNTNKFNQNHLAQLLQIINKKTVNKKKEFGDSYELQIKQVTEKKIKYIVITPKT